jgi:hypothetical protein
MDIPISLVRALLIILTVQADAHRIFYSARMMRFVNAVADEALALETAMTTLESRNEMPVMVLTDLAEICKKLTENSAVPEELCKLASS